LSHCIVESILYEAWICCEKVDDYVSNRNYRLQGIIDTYNVSRKTAKELILVMMYGGCVNQYCCDNGFDITIPMPSWVGELEKEMTLLTDRISSNEAIIFKEVSKLKRRKTKKHLACLMYYKLLKMTLL